MRKLLLTLLVLILTVSSVYGISNITITPSNPKVGDTITISGKANPNEEINCQIWFEIDPIIYPPYYGYIMNNVEIPTTPNSFKIVAQNVNRLYVSLKMGLWVTKNTKANKEGVAVISKSNIPVGTYDIKMGGTIKDPEKPVKLKIFASTKIKADENGNFKYSYRVSNIPEGTVIHLNIGGIKRDIVIKSSLPAPPNVDTENKTDKNTSSNDGKEDHSDTITSIQKESRSTLEDKETSNEEEEYNIPINREGTKRDNHNILVNRKKITPPKPKRENIVYGRIIKNIGSAMLIIPEGTRVSTEGEISIKEVNIPNTTVAYYISPKNGEFSKPLILEIPYNLSQDKKITVLYYDEQLRRWVSIPYTYDGDKITVKVAKSGYYAIKEEYVGKRDEGILHGLYSILDLFRVVVTLLLDYLQHLFK
ncbi:hypothetical protein KKP90_02515 [Methanothermococcus sp. SCGC AD-155-E23]|nr:hypothetical protein [Methanothermococcus sp. SCGC AD-155-E23]